MDRRRLLTTGAGIGLGVLTATAAAPRVAAAVKRDDGPASVPAGLMLGEDPSTWQRTIDERAATSTPLVVPPGTHFIATSIVLRRGTRLSGFGEASRLVPASNRPALVANGADRLFLSDFSVLGGLQPLGAGTDDGLVTIAGSRDIVVSRLAVRNSARHGLVLRTSSGRLSDNAISGTGQAAIFCLDGKGVTIDGNHVSSSANNGILVWSTTPAEDGTHVVGNRIERIAAASGGTGQNGNGINVYRARNVLVAHNSISDCAYSAVRANTASDVQIIANHALRSGEVALYVEFASEGAVVSSNLVDGAASGISITNFDRGGRLAVVQGNLVRNLTRRKAEPVDKRGDGITVEADAAVTGNVVENAPSTGIMIGWGRFLRDVVATGNLVRNAGIGIGIETSEGAGKALVANNTISRTVRGAVRAMRHGVPAGEDLASAPGAIPENIVLSGNLAS